MDPPSLGIYIYIAIIANINIPNVGIPASWNSESGHSFRLMQAATQPASIYFMKENYCTLKVYRQFTVNFDC